MSLITKPIYLFTLSKQGYVSSFSIDTQENVKFPVVNKDGPGRGEGRGRVGWSRGGGRGVR